MTQSDKTQGAGAPAGQGALALPVLALRPRDERFAVIVSGRPSRAGHTPFQIAIPQELYHRLRYEALGSANQVMVALVRQALRWLDADVLTLHAQAHPGPAPASLEAARAIPEGLVGTERQAFERSLDGLWPNACLAVRPREDHCVVIQIERQPRVDAQVTQIALPTEVHQRLLEDGVGAASQLVISLARYALRQLDQENLTLDVMPADTRTSGSQAKTSAGHVETGEAPAAIVGPSLTVAQLIDQLSKQPPEAFVVFEEQTDRWWDLQEIELDYLSPGNPYDDFSNASEQPETPIVLLRGEASVINQFPEGADELIDI